MARIDSRRRGVPLPGATDDRLLSEPCAGTLLAEGSGQIEAAAANCSGIEPSEVERPLGTACSPTLSGPVLISGRRLKVRAASGEIEVGGPRRFLLALYEWCDGTRSLEAIERLAQERWGATQFAAFLRDMLANGVLIDASRYLAHAFEAAQLPSRLGRASTADAWEAGRAHLHAERRAELVAARLLPSRRSPALAALIDARQSARGFGREGVAAESLAALLDAVYGVVADRASSAAAIPRRSVPSAGGFKLLRITLILVRPIEGFAPGVYEVVHPAPGQVGFVPRSGLSNDWCRAFLDVPNWLEAAGFLVLSADTAVSGLKYRNRSLPFALIEAGAALQNGGLAAAELGIGYRVIGGYYTERLASLCQVRQEQLLGCAGFGSMPESSAAASGIARRRFKFHWADRDAGSPVHIAVAEVESPAKSGVGWGRSEDPLRACAIAMSEAVERYSYRQLGECVAAKAAELEGAVDPTSLVRYAPAQLKSAVLQVSAFDPERPYLWAPAVHGPTGRRRAWVPAECVYAARAIPAPYAHHALTRTTSSGCATDADIDVAIARATFEVIERDALARHWLAQAPGSAVGVETCPAPFAPRFARLSKQGCLVSIGAIESLCGPVILVTLESEERCFSALGTACGADLGEALDRALTEAETIASVRLLQPRSPTISAAAVREPMDHSDLYAQRRHFRRIRALTDGARPEIFAALAARWPGSATARLQASPPGHDWLWIDLTVGDAPLGPGGVELRTVRVLIPGCIAIAFGPDAIPRGSFGPVPAAARFPHPLA